MFDFFSLVWFVGCLSACLFASFVFVLFVCFVSMWLLLLLLLLFILFVCSCFFVVAIIV